MKRAQRRVSLLYVAAFAAVGMALVIVVDPASSSSGSSNARLRQAAYLTADTTSTRGPDDSVPAAIGPTTAPGSPTATLPRGTATAAPRQLAYLLRDGGRDRLKICVDGAGPAAAAAPLALQRVAQVLPALSREPKWAESGYAAAAAAPTVQLGCPRDPAVLRPGMVFRDGNVYPLSQNFPVVKQPSEYTIFVFVLPPDQIGKVDTGPRGVRFATQEMTCEAGQCWTVTFAVYVTPAELQDGEILFKWMRTGLGLGDIGPSDNMPVPPATRTQSTAPARPGMTPPA